MTPVRSDSGEARPSEAITFVRQYRNEILAEWTRAARKLRAGRELDFGALVDHIPVLLDEIGDVAEALATDTVAETAFDTARLHAVHRLGEGFDIVDVVRELSLLRACILEVRARRRSDGPTGEITALNLAIDHAIGVCVAQYAERFKRVASQQERTLAQLEALLAASPVGIAFVDRDLRYLQINEALASLAGRPVTDHIGRTVAEMLPEHAPTLEPLLRQVLATGEPIVDLELTRTARSDLQDTRHLLVSFFPVRKSSGETTGVGSVVLDVTGAKRARAALQREQERLQSILDHSPAAIWVKDYEGRVVLANARLASALGHDLSTVIGRRSEELLPPDVAAEHHAHDKMVMNDQRAIEVEEVVPTAEGLRTFLTIKFPIPGDPPLVGGIATEITERKRMEEELRVAVHIREELLAVVSHDLRNPLGTIDLSASLLSSQIGADHRARRHLEMIHRSCERMEHLIDDLLDTASIRARRVKLEIRREAADAVVREALDLAQPLVEEKGINLVRETSVDDVEIACDRNRILQVFGNLIGNALKFCRAGDTITVRAVRADADVLFSVTDTGPGISPDVLALLFEPYWSGPEHATRGSGLGLYISRGLIEAHGGRIWVESAQGRGSTFSFRLPVAN